MATTIVSNNTAATFGNSPQKTGEPVDRLKIYSGKALEFDGVSDYIEPKQGSTYWQPSTHDRMTFAVWIKTTGGGDIFEGGGRIYTAFRIYGQSNVLKVELNSTGIHSDTTIIDDGVWHRIVVSFDKDASSNQVNIYVDGKLSTSHTNTSAISGLNNSNSVHYPMIGANSSALSDNVWGGLMADFQYWTEAWDLEDVKYDYLHPEKLITSNSSATSSIASSSLELWYPMNDTGSRSPQTFVFDGANTGGLETAITPHLNDDGNFNGNNWTITAGDTGDWTGHTSSQTSMTLTKNGTDTGDLRLNLQSSINSGMSSNLEAGAYYKFTHTVSTTSSLPSWQFRINHGGGTTTRIYEGTNSVIYFTAESSSVYIQVRSNTDGQNFTLSNISLEKVKQPFHGTTTFFGDDKLGGNGGFDATSNWSVVSGSVGTEWTINDSSNSKAVHNIGTTRALRYTGSSGDLVNGTTYQIDFTIADRTAGSLTFALGGGSASSSQTASGSIELTAGGTSNRIIDINPTSDFDGSIDSVTVKEVGIATGWTDADQQQTIPQTAFMDGCVKNIFDDSSSYVNFGSASALDDVFVGGATVSFWVYLDLDNNPSSNGGFIHKAGNGNFGWQIYVDNFTSSKYKFRFSQRWNNEDLIQEAHVLKSQQWNHIVITYDASSNSNRATFYLNGAAQTFNVLSSSYDASDSTSITSDASQDLEIGRKSTEGTYQNMIMDDISIFSTELTESQVIALYNDAVPLNATKSAASSNLIGYWKNNVLSSAGTWKDLSTNDNHGTPNNLDDYIYFQQGVTANLCTQGYSNNIVHPSKGSMHFLGQEYAAFPGERIINLDGDFTIEFWFKKTQLHEGVFTDSMLFGSGNNQIRIPTGVSSGKMSVAYYRDAAATSSYTLTVDSNNRKSIYEWSHVAFVRESGTVKLYIDTVTTDNTTISSTGQMQIKLIGAYSVVNSYMYRGFLDDLRVYDKALSEEEITKNYNVSKSQHKNN